jgi:hypothetical protein
MPTTKNILAMKYLVFVLFLFSSVVMTWGQTKGPLEDVVITSNKKITSVSTNENGVLLVNVAPKDAAKFNTIGWVRYSDFGAKGDGKTDDIDAIAAPMHSLIWKAF